VPSAWHAIGVRIGTLSSYIERSYSTGEVRLNSPDPDDEPDVNFNWLSDPRDLDRMVDAFRRMASILSRDPVPQYMSNLFASKFSQRVRSISQKNLRNNVLTNMAAMMMDSSASLRSFLFDKVISDSPPLRDLLADLAGLERHVRENVQSAWHASCTCRMGYPTDVYTVVDPGGKVRRGESVRRRGVGDVGGFSHQHEHPHNHDRRANSGAGAPAVHGLRQMTGADSQLSCCVLCPDASPAPGASTRSRAVY
jgi:5-(hydroxymethyl)furfural/furfural oxidase